MGTCPGLPAATAPSTPSWPSLTACAPGTSCWARIRRSARPTPACSDSAWRNLDWLVVRDFSLTESATWWRNGPEIETGEMRTEDIKTEVFFLPAAAHTEKDGSFTNTQRLLQWHHTAVEPVGDARSELWFIYHLGLRIRQKLAAAFAEETAETDRPVLDLTWDYPVEGAAGRARRGGRARRDQRVGFRRQTAIDLHPAQGRRLHVLRLLDLRRRVRRRGEPGRPARTRRASRTGSPRVGLGVAGEPAVDVQPCLGRPGRPAVERTQGATSGGTRKQPLDRTRRARLHRRPTAGLHPARRAQPAWPRSPARIRSSCRPTARRGCSPRPAWSTGRCPRTTSRRSRPFANVLYGQQRNPVRQLIARPQSLYQPERERAGIRSVPVRRSPPTG